MTDNYRMIETAVALRELVCQLREEPCVAMDAEFVWERTFYARLGLVQLATASGACFLLDPLGVGDLSPLGEVLTDIRVVKILHDAPQDLMILRRATGAAARNVFDTRTAAGFAGLSACISLQDLLARMLDVRLPKGHTRTDWLARPLSPEQLEYAADDVAHLNRVAVLLRDRARLAGVEAWLNAELATLDGSALYEERVPEECYRRIRAAATLPPRHLAVLRELAAWRERVAMETDRPRRRLAEDHELVAVATDLPRGPDELRKCRRLEPRTARRYGPPLLAGVERGMAVPDSDLPSPLLPPGCRRCDRERVTAVIEQVRLLAEKRGLDPQLVCSRNDVVRLLGEGRDARVQDCPMLGGWRAELLGPMLASYL